jgi:biopolymer transport protein ExbB/TolQ
VEERLRGMHVVESIVSWPVVKWIIGGLAGIIAMLAGVVWRRQTATIQSLEDEVKRLHRDSRNYVTHEHMEEFRDEVRDEMRGVHTSLSHHTEKVQAALTAHNSEVTSRLDNIFAHIIKMESKK